MTGLVERFTRYENINRNCNIIGHQKRKLAADLNRAYKLTSSPLKYFNNLSLCFPPFAHREEMNLHLVTVQRVAGVIGGNKHILIKVGR